MGFCDTSFANLVNRGSQGGFVVFLCDDDGQYCPIVWQSQRLHRVVSSTLAAECLAAMEVADTFWVPPFPSASCVITIQWLILSTTQPLFRANASLSSSCVLQDMILRGEIQKFHWVFTNYQVANTLTKAGSCPEYLLDILRCSMTFQGSSGTFIRA